MASGTPTLAGKCVDLYERLNTFVTNVITRDVTPKITNLNTEVWGSNTQTGDSRIDDLETDVSSLNTDVTSLNDSITNHTHDNRYYTEAEVRSLINQSIKIVFSGQINFGNLSANGNAEKTANITIPSGYSVLTVFPRTWYGCDSFSIVLIYGSTISVKAWNLSANSHGAWVTVVAICIKNG